LCCSRRKKEKNERERFLKRGRERKEKLKLRTQRKTHAVLDICFVRVDHFVDPDLKNVDEVMEFLVSRGVEGGFVREVVISRGRRGRSRRRLHCRCDSSLSNCKVVCLISSCFLCNRERMRAPAFDRSKRTNIERPPRDVGGARHRADDRRRRRR